MHSSLIQAGKLEMDLKFRKKLQMILFGLVIKRSGLAEKKSHTMLFEHILKGSLVLEKAILNDTVWASQEWISGLEDEIF